MRDRSTKLISILLVISMIVGLFVYGAVPVSAASVNTVMTTDAVRLRSSAEITSGNVITTLEIGEVLTLLKDSVDGWAQVRRSDGTTGYSSVDYLQPVSGSSVVLSGVTNDVVNFRKGPSTNYESLGLLEINTKFTVVDNSDEMWVKATVNGTTGYIYRSYTDLSLKLGTVVNPQTGTPDWFNSSMLEDLLGDSYQSDNSNSLADNITLSDSVISIEEGSSYTLMAYVAGGLSVQSSVIFTTSNKNIATVSASGVVYGVSQGTATITATAYGSGKTSSCTVTVTEQVQKPTIPTEPETQPPTPPAGDLELSVDSASVNVGNHFHLFANEKVSWKSSDSSVATVSNGIVTGKSTGTAKITAYTSAESVSCTITVTAASTSVSIYDDAVTITKGKTFFNSASPSSVSWSSSDSSVATVTNGFITAVSQGVAVISATTSSGVKTCFVTVTDAEPVRFAYCEPNTVAPGGQITLCAVTDKNRTAVKFEITIGNTVRTINATSSVDDSNTKVWTATTSISSAGTYKVVAYSKTGSGSFETSSVQSDATASIFVRTTSDITAETLETRRPSDNVIRLIADFEGYSPCVYFDTIADNLPTLGYGRVVYKGDSFYNDMTKKEAYAYLVRTVNEGGYTSSVNNYLDKYSIYRNQAHFDSLVSFVYNTGTYALTGDSDFLDIFLATGETSSAAPTGKEAYISGSGVNFRTGPGTDYSSQGTLEYGTVLELIETEPSNNWYHVKIQSGTEGYVHADYVKVGVLTSSGKCKLSNVNRADFTHLMLQYHHVGRTCIWGLLYRRVDELDIFYYGDYARDGKSNKYGYKYVCTVNSSTTIG